MQGLGLLSGIFGNGSGPNQSMPGLGGGKPLGLPAPNTLPINPAMQQGGLNRGMPNPQMGGGMQQGFNSAFGPQSQFLMNALKSGGGTPGTPMANTPSINQTGTPYGQMPWLNPANPTSPQ